MGYLGNLDKIKTLELFLTDKGKELMLKENGLGLFDLITQFSLDDRDYDYRRTSNVWVDGISPIPDGSLLPYGTTQSLSNNSGGPVWFDNLSNNNPCRSCYGTNCAPLSGDCWYDMPDVRGDRGRIIENCYSDTGQTQGIRACTNIYAFYDVTSVSIANATAAKIGLNSWFNTLTATTPNYIGKLFHIAVFGERWVNTSWYPWNGKLDTWDWTPCGNGYVGAPCAGNSSTFLGDVSGPTTIDTSTDIPTTVPVYPDPVTGLYLQNSDGSVSGLPLPGDWTGFNVLPPNAISTDTGGRAEFWTTGCTLVNPKSPHYDYNETDGGTVESIPFTTTDGVNFVFATTAFTGTIFSAYTPNDFIITTPTGMPQEGTSFTLFGNLVLNACEDNCCPSNYPDLDYRGPGLFACQECNPFDNTITNGFIYKFINKQTTYTSVSRTGVSGGTMDLMLRESVADCVKYRGMDRNVLVVDVFDETAGGQDQDPAGGVNPRSAGVLPLGRKNFYNGTDGIPGNFVSATLGDPDGEASPNWQVLDYTGYHGRLDIGEPPTLTDNWGIYLPGSQIQARQQQPTLDWKYSQDLFLKTHGLYENFQGFVYPVVPLDDPVEDTNSARMVFPLHLYGALYGDVVPLNEFQDNPTVVARGGTLSACTITNAYSGLTPITYNPNGVSQMNYNSNLDWEPFDSSQFGPLDAISPLGGPVKGLRNWGWQFNPTVGCSSLPCNVADIFSGGTFQSDLDSFVTGSSYFITVTTTACTECQCLPAVFINKQGPIIVIDDDDEGCLCPDGTYDPKCCEGDPPEPDDPIYGICGPLPEREPTSRPGGSINANGSIVRPERLPDFSSPGEVVPRPSPPLSRRSTQFDRNVKTTEPPLNTKSISGEYSSKYSIDFNITLNQFLEDDGKVNWDVKFTSTSQYGSKILEEGDGVEFYWVLTPGYVITQRNPKMTQACKSPSYSLIKENKRSYKGVNISFLKGYWDENSKNALNYKSEYRGETSYEFCVTMAYKYLGKVLKKTKRFGITGTEAGYRINIKS